MSLTLWVLGSSLAVSIIALLAAIPLLIKKQLSRNVLVILLSISVGTLLATVSLHFLPEIFGEHEVHIEEPYQEMHLEEMHEENLTHEQKHIENIDHEHAQEAHEEEHHEEEIALTGPLMILTGFLVFFILEKLIHYHHSHKEEEITGHGHAYHLAPINLIGDAVHNFIDGLIIAAAYVVSIPVGIAATISVLLHELPQEIADMGVLLYAGLSKTKAVLYNFAVAAIALLGAAIGLLLAESEHFVEYMLPFAAGIFIYIAASNLVPELHRDCSVKDTAIHVISIVAGIAIMVALYFLLPHSH
jgi:zinc and cadmium transporter